MKKKVFSLMMTLLLAFMGVAKADVVTVGSGTETSTYVPSYSYYKFDISQQIYTAAEIGYTGTINSIAFYNNGAEKTRTWDVYMVKTTKTAFDSNSDWITVSSSDLVFSGSVTMTAGAWTALTLSTPFDFDGTTNLAIIVDDNTGSYLPSPHMECLVFNGADDCAIYTYNDNTNFDPLSSISSSGTRIAKKNQLQLDMNVTGTVGPGSVTFDDKLHVKYMDGTTEVIDSLNLGVRPINAWMAPFEFVMYSEGPTYTVNVLDFTPSDGIFSIVDAELPFEVAPSADVDLLMSTDGTQAGVVERQFVAIAEERAAHIWPVVVEFYEPEVPDVVEKPCVDAVNFPFVERPAIDHGTTLHNDYTLPFPEIPEGYDAVYKLVFDHDVMLTASVTDGENGKVALYRENFEGEGGPMADNYYQGPIGGAGGSGGSSAGFEAMIGDETSTTTTTYFPFHTLWKYSLSENLFLASELSAAGVTTSPMTSLSWYVSSMTCTTPQNGISIWMANVSDTELTGTSHLTSGMTLVYTGTNVLPVAGQWNEFEFNGGNFAWDGHSNVLVVCQRQNGAWEGSISWQTHNPGFTAMSYNYTDTDPGYDATTTTYTMSTSTINRANIVFKSDRSRGMAKLSNPSRHERSAGHPGARLNPNAASFSPTHDGLQAMLRGSNAYGMQCYGSGATPSMSNGFVNFDVDDFASTCSLVTSDYYAGGVAYNPNTGHYYIADFVGYMFYEVDLASGTVVNSMPTYYGIVSLCYNPATNELYGTDSDAYVFYIDPSSIDYTEAYFEDNVNFYYGGELDVYTNDGRFPYDLTVGPDGDLYAMVSSYTSSSEDALLVKVDPYSATTTTMATLNKNCWFLQGFEYDANTGVFVWAQEETAGGSLITIDPSTYAMTTVSTGIGEIMGLCIPAVSGGGSIIPEGMSYGPVIAHAAIEAGTYYLVASSTDPDFEVTINAETMPCPGVEGFAFGPTPADDADGIEPGSVTLRWNIPAYATGWRLVFGSTYYPDPSHPQTIMYPEDGSFSNELANSFTVRDLWNNTNYFWHVEFNNDGCPDGVSSPIWGFTTHLNIPQNLTVEDETVFNDEQIVLHWNPVVDRTYRMYYIYRDGVKVGETETNNINATSYTDGPLAYNMSGYTYYVTAVYDEGESAPSDPVTVKVSGYGDVDGHVYEQDGTTGIANATVTMVGQDEFGDPHTYTFTTNAEGFYTGHIYAGSYDGSAACNGYQDIDEPVQGNPIAITYNNTTSPIDYKLDENFYGPCSVVAEYYPDSLDPESPYVKVYWGCGLPGNNIIEDFETGDFSMFDWQLHGTYPWSITTTNPYEGTYCMKSGGAGVANVVSDMSVAVEIPNDGVMSFFGKISCENNWDYGYFYIDGVQKGQYTGAGSWTERSFDITAGTHTFKWSYTKDGSVNSNDDCFYVDYINFYKQPEPALPGTTYDFENSTMQGWTSLDADGDGYGWYVASEIMTTGYGHDGSNDCVLSQSYSHDYGILYPDNYLVSPQVPLGGLIRFYACAQDASYAAEHFGVAVSTTTNNNASAFTMLQEWTMTAKSGDGGKPVERNTRSGRAQGAWYEYTVDLSAYAGQTGYVAIRHFNCHDMFYLDVDDITISEPGKSLPNNDRAFSHYRVYRTNCYNDGPYTEENTMVLSCELHDTIYIDTYWADPEVTPPGVYKWGVGCVYVGNRGEEIEGPISWTEPVVIAPEKANRDQVFDFENGVIPAGWTNDGTYPWTVVNDAYAGYNGTYCIKSGNGGVSNSTSSISTTMDYSEAGTVSFLGGFWGEGSSDTYDWDKCRFYIDGNIMIDYGAHDAWENVSFPVSAGSHTFTWTYKKDGSVNPTGDAFFVDDVTFTVGGGSGGSGGGSGSGTYGPGTEPIQEPRESVIVWSNCLDKDMYLSDVDVNVLLNSADSPEGVTVTMTNLNEVEQGMYPVAPVILDESGFYAWDTFRKGEYAVKVEFDGYEPINDTVSIWSETHLRYVMTEILYGVENVYVSRTGWAMWDDSHNNPGGGGTGGGGGGGTGATTFTEGFEGSLNGWTVIDVNAGEGTWLHSDANLGGYDYTTHAHGGTGFAMCYSFVDYVGSFDTDSYLVTPQKYDIVAGSTLNFWADNANDSYPENFSVCVSTADTPTASSFTSVWSGSAKGGSNAKANVRHMNDRYDNWRSHSVDLSAYAGQSVWIAFHDVNEDMYEVWIDDVALTAGAKSDERHLEYYKVMCTSIDGVPIFNHNTVHPFCQLSTDEPYNAPLVEGERYLCKVACMYSTGLGAWSEPVEWVYEPCDHWGPVDDVAVTTNSQGNRIQWTFDHGFNPYDPGAGGEGYAAPTLMPSGMLSNGTYALNITDVANFDERVYFLYNLTKDDRFEVVNGETAGMFIVSAAAGYEEINLEDAIHNFSYNNSIEFSLMDKVQAADVANAYKSAMPASFTNSLMMDLYIQSRENNMCEFADPFCTDNGMYEFPAGVNAGSGESGPDYDCLYTQPNPAWYYMRIGAPGEMDIHMYSTPEVDIDFCCWGPFDDPTTPCPYGLTDDKVVSCSYSTSWTEHCMIPASAQTGEYYILVITNYSNQPCNINFSMVAGNGSTDCGILPPVDIIGFLITQDGEYLAFAGPTDREYTDIDEFGDHEYCVRPIYPGEQVLPDHNYGWSMGCPVCNHPGGGFTCDPGEPIHAEELHATDQVKIWWGEAPAAPISEWLYYDDGVYGTSVGAGGTLYWGTMFPAASLNAYAGTSLTKVAIHTSYACSATLNVYVGGAQPSGSPAATQTFTMAGDQEFMEVTLNNPVAIDGTQNLWITFYQTGETYPADACADTGDANNRWVSIDGASWMDLSTAGLPGYGWMIRGFVTNQAKGGEVVALPEFRGNVGGELSHSEVVSKPADLSFMNRSEIVKYNVYRSTSATGDYALIGEVTEESAPNYYEYIDTPEVAGTYYYQVTAVYDDGCESDPAPAYDDPSVNYVTGTVDGIGENSDNVALYPNPTSGNVTIEANGMSRITVMSVLGQVVYDTEVKADNYTLNMAQFNAGMYLVRVYTENGVTVKRVTVMQ